MLNDSFTTTPIAAGTAGTQGVTAAANQRLLGFEIRESAGSPAVAEVNLRHGTTNTDTVVAPIVLVASGTTQMWMGPDGVPVPNGVYVDRVSGNTKLTLFTQIM